MVLTMQVRFLSCIILSACHGFLLTNKTGIPSVGTSGLTDYHYLMLTDALGVQKQLLSQMETFVLQLQNELKTVNQEVKDLKSGNNAAQSLAVVELKNETSELREQNAKLQNSFDILQKKFDTIQNENNVLKHNNAALKSQITDSHNLSIHTKQELDSFTHSIAAANIQNATSIQRNMDSLTSQMKTLNSQIYSLTSTSTSRSQDFLALLNKTNAADLKLDKIDRWSNSFQNLTKNQLILLQVHATSSSHRLDSLEQNFSLVSKEIRTVKGKVQEMSEPVALTSCGSGSADYSSGQIIKFPIPKTSLGINNVTEFTNTGQFTCEKSGLYLFSVYITRYASSNVEYQLYRNTQLISYVMIEYGASGDYSSGSGTVVVQINAGDILYAKVSGSGIKIQGSYSCFTVIKVL